MATYKERYLTGEIEFEEIDEYTFQWGISDDERTLAQYLGLNAEEEDAWVSIGEEALKELLDKQRQKYQYKFGRLRIEKGIDSLYGTGVTAAIGKAIKEYYGDKEV